MAVFHFESVAFHINMSNLIFPPCQIWFLGSSGCTEKIDGEFFTFDLDNVEAETWTPPWGGGDDVQQRGASQGTINGGDRRVSGRPPTPSSLQQRATSGFGYQTVCCCHGNRLPSPAAAELGADDPERTAAPPTGSWRRRIPGCGWRGSGGSWPGRRPPAPTCGCWTCGPPWCAACRPCRPRPAASLSPGAATACSHAVDKDRKKEKNSIKMIIMGIHFIN